MTAATSASNDLSTGVDARGPRVAAGLTTALLAVALVVQGPVGTALVGVQVLVFAIAVALGVRHSPWAWVFRVARSVLALGPPSVTEDPAPPRFAQACGLVVAGAGLAALLFGALTVGWLLVGVVLVLSTLLAATGLCIGCEVYVVLLRVRPTR